MTRRDVRGAAKRQAQAEDRARKEYGGTAPGGKSGAFNAQTADAFVNFQQKFGVGSDNPLSTSSYGFNPITRVRTLLEWMYRGSWVCGVAVDTIADDMTRAGVELKGHAGPDDIQRIEELATSLGVWNSICETIKWARLYGGSLAFMMIEGQNPETPLRLETIGRDQFKGLLVLDRWMVQPSMESLITDYGPDMGKPKFYTVVADAAALPAMKIHHSRCIRLEGDGMPYWQRLMENLWGCSVYERLYDRLIAFDSATTGAAQLIYKSYMRVLSVDGLRETIASDKIALDALVKYVQMMARFQSIEGVTMIDAADKLEALNGSSSFSGLSDALMQFGQQISGATQIPLVRLFGQSPAGLSATGESDIRNYYDGIAHRQNTSLKVPVTRVYRAMAQSLGISLEEGFSVKFRSLWQLSEKEKAETAEIVGRTVGDAEERGLISPQTAMKELKQSSEITGIFTNITDEDIEAASDEAEPPAAEEVLGGGEGGGKPGEGGGDDAPPLSSGGEPEENRGSVQ